MPCRILGCVLLSTFSCLYSFGQLLNNWDTNPQSPSTTYGRTAEGQVSVARLRVPRKAMELYNHALDALRMQMFEHAKKNIEQAPQIYPGYPDALALRGRSASSSKSGTEPNRISGHLSELIRLSLLHTSDWPTPSMQSYASMTHSRSCSRPFSSLPARGIFNTKPRAPSSVNTFTSER